jgi:hypothetical protein
LKRPLDTRAHSACIKTLTLTLSARFQAASRYEEFVQKR